MNRPESGSKAAHVDRTDRTPSRGLRSGARALLVGACLAAAGLSLTALAAKAPAGIFPAGPVLPAPKVPLQFDVIGFIQEATLDTADVVCPKSPDKLRGGFLRVNGQIITVPCNTVLQMPATSLSWADLFDPSLVDTDLIPTSAAAPMTGMALRDKVKPQSVSGGFPYSGPLPSYEVRVQGNIVDGKYIAGLIFISQQSVNAGTGVINCIDYVKAELHIGGKAGTCSTGDTRVRINDPVGRFGKSHGKPKSGADLIEVGYDKRFTADTDNPTVKSDSGYPMCIPRKDPFVARGDPASGFDPLCPQYNRPVAPNCRSLPNPFPTFVQPANGQYCKTWVMSPPVGDGTVLCATALTNPAACATDPTRQAPFAIGDHVDYVGNVKVDDDGPYFSAHTLTAHLGIYTEPGTRPSYVALEGLLQGTGALPIGNLPQEATSLVKIEGMSTDPTMQVDLYAVDIDPLTGTTSERILGTSNPSGPPVIGRFRFKPAGGAFLPASKEMRAVSRNMCGSNDSPCAMPGTTQAWGPVAEPLEFANGLVAGQYRAPNFDFIFPEPTVVGDPMVPANLQDLAFLYCGSGPLSTLTVPAGTTGPVVGQLNPSPWGAPMLDPAFRSVLCPKAKTVAAPVVVPVIDPKLADAVAFQSAAFDDRAGRGKLNVVAIQAPNANAPANQPAPQLYIEMTGFGYDPTIGLYREFNWSPTPQPMTLVQNSANAPAICPVGFTTCWVYNATGVINDPLNSGAFLAPYTITISSSLGGSQKVDKSRVTIR